MAQATDLPTTSRFHNLSTAALAKRTRQRRRGAEGRRGQCKALKDEIKRRGLLETAGDSFAIRVSEQISGRLDVQCGLTQHARICASRRRPIHSRLTPGPRARTRGRPRGTSAPAASCAPYSRGSRRREQ